MKRVLLFLSVVLSLSSFGGSMSAIRLDPGYLYHKLYSSKGGTSASSVARLVANDISAAGFNTIFVLAYAPDSGAYYPTNYPGTVVEEDFGRNDFLRALLKESHGHGIQVIAWLPVNNFKQVWMKNPSWRSKNKRGADYKPSSDSFFLSVWHEGFQNWFAGFLTDLLTRYPDLDGIEAGEVLVDYNWDRSSDYNPMASQAFQRAFPNARVGSAEWVQFRADGLTQLCGLMGKIAHRYHKIFSVVQTWSIKDDGSGELMSSEDIRDGSGFDFDGIMNLPKESRPDILVGEFMWQQWRDSYRDRQFNPAWTLSAAASFVKKVGDRSVPIIHVEASPFGRVSPTNKQILQSVIEAQNVPSGGFDIYDYHQLNARKILKTLLGPVSP